MKKMAVIATNGAHNKLVTMLTTVMAASVCEMAVRIFFRDEAVYKLSRKKIAEINLSPIYADIEEVLKETYRASGMDNLQKVIQGIKSDGDVKLYACTSSMALIGLTQNDLIPEIDDLRGLTSFLLEEMDNADMILSF